MVILTASEHMDESGIQDLLQRFSAVFDRKIEMGLTSWTISCGRVRRACWITMLSHFNVSKLPITIRTKIKAQHMLGKIVACLLLEYQPGNPWCNFGANLFKAKSACTLRTDAIGCGQRDHLCQGASRRKWQASWRV